VSVCTGLCSANAKLVTVASGEELTKIRGFVGTLTRRLENSDISPSHKRNKIIARKIGSFLGAEAQQIEDEHDDEDEDDSLISGSGFN
jgi:hypothetical protein